jgi:hypothetical protein
VRIAGGHLLGAGIALAQRHALAGVDDRAGEAGRTDGRIEPLLEADAVLDHDLGSGDRLNVGGRGLVVVRVDVRLDDLGDRDVVAADVPDEVRDLGRGGHDR